MLAPIALYPDELVSQILMASTYPLEVVQADRWAKSHKQSAGDVLTKQLEKEPWDPSVKSLINFPTVLASMSEKLDVTTKIGDAFLAQEGDVMATIQLLRKKAYDAGNLKTTKEQKVVVEKEIIIIQPANPQVIYVPTYSPTVVYGVWAYPAYPPYYYYPPPPPSYPAYSFAVGVAVGAAWGYAWGNCNWHGATATGTAACTSTTTRTSTSTTTSTGDRVAGAKVDRAARDAGSTTRNTARALPTRITRPRNNTVSHRRDRSRGGLIPRLRQCRRRCCGQSSFGRHHGQGRRWGRKPFVGKHDGQVGRQRCR